MKKTLRMLALLTALAVIPAVSLGQSAGAWELYFDVPL